MGLIWNDSLESHIDQESSSGYGESLIKSYRAIELITNKMKANIHFWFGDLSYEDITHETKDRLNAFQIS